MRRVKFKKFIPHKYMGDGYTVVQGTGKFQEDFETDGMFHCWGSNYEEFGDIGVGTYTVAIVEVEDGTIVEVLPEKLKFC